jgi:hypothetical protein
MQQYYVARQSMADSWKNFPRKASLTEQFYETAMLYGRLIVSERPLPNALRTIKPVNIGGLSGLHVFFLSAHIATHARL